MRGTSRTPVLTFRVPLKRLRFLPYRSLYCRHKNSSLCRNKELSPYWEREILFGRKRRKTVKWLLVCSKFPHDDHILPKLQLGPLKPKLCPQLPNFANNHLLRFYDDVQTKRNKEVSQWICRTSHYRSAVLCCAESTSPTNVNLLDRVMDDVRYSRFARFPGKAGWRIEDRGLIMISNDEEIIWIRDVRC